MKARSRGAPGGISSSSGLFGQGALDSMESQIAVLDEETTVIAVNHAWTRFTSDNDGTPSACGVGRNYADVCAAATDATATTTVEALQELLSGRQDEFSIEYPCSSPTQERWFELRATTYRGPGPARLVVAHHDVTARHLLNTQNRLQATLLQRINASVIATDAEGRIRHWNRAAEELYGWTSDEVLGRSITEVMVRPEDEDSAARIMAEVRDRGEWSGEFPVRRRDGTTVPALASNSMLFDENGKVDGFVGVSVDLSDRVEIERKLERSLGYQSAITDGMGEGVLAVDPENRLAYMNNAAEKMLGWRQEDLIGKVLHSIIHFRHQDGSHFPIEECPLHRAGQEGAVARIADDLFIRKDGTELPVAYTASPYETDCGGRGSVVVFRDNTNEKQQRVQLQHTIDSLDQLKTLRDALDGDRLVAYAQPVISLLSDEVVKHELLVRMLDPDGTVIYPGEFLPAAEEYGMVAEIDRFMLCEAARLAGSGNPVAVNVSAHSMRRDTVEHLRVSLTEFDADSSMVVVEITETALAEDQDAAMQFVTAVRALGCRIALDDFGTGYGGFDYIKRFPLDFLKIDIEFVRDLLTNEGSGHVVEAVVSLARSFGLKTIAEGAEDSETLVALREYGVDLAQGYVIARPGPVENMIGAAKL